MGYRGLIVGLSGDVGDAIVKEFLQYGADDVLPKPFNVDDLDQIVVDFRQRQKERKAAAEKEQKTPPGDALGALRILVVDDSGSTRLAHQMIDVLILRMNYFCDGQESDGSAFD